MKIDLPTTINNAFRNNKFKNLLSFSANALIWSLPLVGFAYSSMGDKLVFMSFGIGAIQGISFLGAQVSEKSFLTYAPYIKKSINNSGVKLINKINREFILKHKEKLISKEDIATIASYYLYAPEMSQLQSYVCFPGIENKSNVLYLKDLKEIYTFIDKYTYNFENEINKHMNEKERHLNISSIYKDEIHTNEYLLRINFILKYPYTLREQDYNGIEKLIKSIINKSSTRIVNEKRDFLLNFIQNKNLSANWDRLNALFVKNYVIKDDFLLKLRDIIKNKQQVIINNRAIENEKLYENLLNYSLAFSGEKLKEIKQNYDYINERIISDAKDFKSNVLIKEFSQKLLDILPCVITHDENIKKFKSSTIIEQLKENINSLLDLLIEDSKKIIYDIEAHHIKEIKVMAKYENMKKHN